MAEMRDMIAMLKVLGVHPAWLLHDNDGTAIGFQRASGGGRKPPHAVEQEDQDAPRRLWQRPAKDEGGDPGQPAHATSP
jgi:hypothetical protein